MRSLLVFPILAVLAACAAHAETVRPSPHWNGLVIQAETELTQEHGLVFAAGPTLEFTHDRMSAAAGILFSLHAPVVHAEGRFYPFLWNDARPYLWGGAYARLGGHGPGFGLDGGIGYAVSLGHLHASLTLGVEHGLAPDDETYPLLGCAVGWHL